MQYKAEEPAATADEGATQSKLSTRSPDEKEPTTQSNDDPSEEPEQNLTLHGLRLWLLLAVLYLGIYLLALELTMLSTVIPTLTDEFHTVADISWYEAAYVLPL